MHSGKVRGRRESLGESVTSLLVSSHIHSERKSLPLSHIHSSAERQLTCSCVSAERASFICAAHLTKVCVFCLGVFRDQIGFSVPVDDSQFLESNNSLQSMLHHVLHYPASSQILQPSSYLLRHPCRSNDSFSLSLFLCSPIYPLFLLHTVYHPFSASSIVSRRILSSLLLSSRPTNTRHSLSLSLKGHNKQCPQPGLSISLFS